MRSAAHIVCAAACILTFGACGETGKRGGSQLDANNPTDQAALLTANCSGCHAPGGAALVPLDGLSRESIAALLRQYRADKAGTTVMHRLARGFSDEDVATIAKRLGKDKGT